MTEQTQSTRKAQIVYFSHGGGPLPILGDPGHKAMVEFMQKLPSQLRRPDSILVISAHWEESVATMLGAENPPMFYDYYGFPDQAYRITYPAPGDLNLVERVTQLLQKNQIATKIDPRRGYDHGVFIPLKMMYPQADIPVAQLSLIRGLDPAVHIALGRALRDLLTENILVIGSGFSFHNQSAFFGHSGVGPDSRNDAFQDWLIETAPVQSANEREERLIRWGKAPKRVSVTRVKIICSPCLLLREWQMRVPKSSLMTRFSVSGELAFSGHE
jgi:aromatic ring-opening dioxygenase catalytic subunit (LigB family)